ncbi:FAD-dependent oxidoreductase [Hypericibacter terrae]|uniref:FAD-dependent oxidoreductase n=1 Tax=Hypericibacter terrae TaxID=2602015 RepID=A0A5J6MNY3_9PROT|nr:FAD-dependent oxidoreductase [Hypericibacter terrae]QEX19104.1 FAD-dependent oxidoreductase [Hypericibacter terrae]
MTAALPTQAQVVIIGGGVIGCSIAYHLAQTGCRDVVLVERHRLTSGSTWHAAGGIGQLRQNANVTRLLRESVKLYERLEAETGQATGWVRNGSLRLASSQERRAEYEVAATRARSFGIPFEFVGPDEIRRMVPTMTVDDLVCAAFVADDGIGNPSDIALALAKGARMKGARIFEHTKVTGITLEHGRVAAVVTDQGAIRCETLVNCGGIWAREIGRLAGVNVPLQPSHHQYFVTERIEGLKKNFPTIRDTDNNLYFKEEVGGLIVGQYEFDPIPYLEDPIPEGHEFKLMPENIAQFEPRLPAAAYRFPSLEKAGIKRWFNGIESFTEDGMFILGEAPEVDRFFVAAGFNAFGIASAGGAGMAMAHWILHGEPPFDLWPADIRRFGAFHRSKQQILVRGLEGQAHHFAMLWPHLEFQAGRPLRRSAVHHLLQEQGACFGAKFGWERANWFAPKGVEPRDIYTFDRPNWFPHVAAEHRACRETVALFDQSPFAKYHLSGRDAASALDRLCAARLKPAAGSVTYTQVLNRRGGIEADLTVTRRRDGSFFIVTGTGFATRDFVTLRNGLAGADAHLMDVTSAYGCLSLMGPKARNVLAQVAEEDISDAAFPYGTAQDLFLDGAPVLALRVGFAGELGWELYVPCEYMVRVHDALVAAGAAHGLRHGGYRALDSLRMEKARRVWAAEINPDYTPFEAGLGFAVDLEKPDFVGRDALLRQRETGVTRRLVAFVVEDPDTLLYGRETIYRDGERVGWLASGGFGFTLDRAIGLGYVNTQGISSAAQLAEGRYELEVRTHRVAAKPHLKSPYDPDNIRIRG